MALLHYAPPMSPYLDILFYDDDIVVLNKPCELLSVPGKDLNHKDSLELRVKRVFPTCTVVHRLDMATSGIIIMARNKASHVHISRQFEQRQTSKTYFAEIFGHPKKQQGDINLPLICDWPNRPKQMVDHERGKPSLTHWQVIEHYKASTLVKLTPVTGRSHQLRVHMLAIGHPILGDRLYAHDEARKARYRLCLHAQELVLRHPTTEEPLTFSRPYCFN